MKNTLTSYRNKIIHGLYKGLLKPIFFRQDPEEVHDQMTKVGANLGKYKIGRAMVSGMFDYENAALTQKILGINFENPIGLSAGFDKNGELTDIMPSVGFGFTEIGSITAKKCEGNAKPRLWRLPKSQSLVVNYGLKNDGCEAIAERLRGKKFGIPLGISVAMTNCKENLDLTAAVKDYEKAFRTMEPFASYITVNVSCPNLEHGQPFLAPHKLDYLFDVLDEIPTLKPIFIKMSPDLAKKELANMLDVAWHHRIHGIITTNLTKKRDNQKIMDEYLPELGGMSGKVVQDAADAMLAFIYKKAKKRFILIGSGGVFTAADAYKKIRLGASLVQMITGMIYEGPQVIGEINRGLAELLKRDGYANIHQAIGADNC